MSRSSSGALAMHCLLAVLVSSGCIEPDVYLGPEIELPRVVAVDAPAQFTTELDLLFVVDNTSGMSSKQDELVKSFELLMSHMKFFADPQGVPLDLEIAVVSTDMGVGTAYAVEGCSAVGDNASFRFDRTLDLQLTEDLGIIDADHPAYRELEEMVTMGESGCPFEQPLQAMKTAMEHSIAQGRELVRPGAALAVVVLSNEDDCSVLNSELFNPALDPMKPKVDKFRCFSHGVRCDGDDVWVAGGRRSDCKPRENSEYVASVSSFVDFLSEQKDPSSLVVTGVVGDSDIIEVRDTMESGLQVVSQQCGSITESKPAVRLQSFVEAFDEQGEVAPLCGEKEFYPIARTARKLRKSLGTACLEGAIADIDPVQPGRQPDCLVSLRYADQSEIEIPQCDALPVEREQSSQVPCYVIGTGHEPCGDFRTQLSVDVWWGWADAQRTVEKAQPPGSRIIGKCLVDEIESIDLPGEAE